MVSPQTLIDRAKTVLGAKYKWGAKPDPNDPHPTESDCSGFTRWLLGGAGIRLESSSIWQYRAAVKAGLDVPVSEAIDQPGYLLFRFGSDPVTSWPDDRHVAFTVGGGLVAEATGRPHWNIGIYPTSGRTWTHAARIAGLNYNYVGDSMPLRDYETEAIQYLQDRGIFTEQTTDEPGEPDEPVTVRLLAVVLWRTVRHIEELAGDTPPGSGVTADRAAAMISQAVGDLTSRMSSAIAGLS